MPLRLIVTRHAKAAPGAPGQPDHARPLAERGRSDAPRMGRWLAGEGYAPDAALCSDAARTRETLELMLPQLGAHPKVHLAAGLYEAPAERILDQLRWAEGGTIMLVGHNPGIGNFAARIVSQAPDHARFDDFTTCATLVAELDLDAWGEAGFGTAKPLAFRIPADL